MNKLGFIFIYVLLIILSLYEIFKGLKILKNHYYIEDFKIIGTAIIVFSTSFILYLIFSIIYSIKFLLVPSIPMLFIGISCILVTAVALAGNIKKLIIQGKVNIGIYNDSFENILNKLELILDRAKVNYKIEGQEIIINDGRASMLLSKANFFIPNTIEIINLKEIKDYGILLLIENLCNKNDNIKIKSKIRLSTPIIVGVVSLIISILGLYIFSIIKV